VRSSWIVVVLLTLLSLVACTATPTTPNTDATGSTNNTTPAEVSFMVFGDSAELAAYESLVATFSAAHPDIKVNLSNVPGQSDYRQRLAASFANGSPPDIMLLNYRRFAAFAQSGIEPIGPYLEKSTVIKADDFFEPTIAAYTYEGQLWCIPQNISSLVVYYNRDLFDAAGIAYPANDWTWDDFLTAARALTLDTDGDGTTDQFGAGVEGSLFRLAPFVWSAGGDIVDDPVNPTRLTLDDPTTLAAFQWFVDLQVKEKVVPDAVAESAEESESRFINGRLGMFFNSRRGTPTYREIESFTWDVAPLPYDKVPTTILHTDAFCMAKVTQNKDAAWTFIEYANSPEGQTILAESGRTVPSLKSVAESDAFMNPDQPPANNRAAFIDTIPTMRAVPIMENWVNIEELGGEEVKRAFYGDATVEEAAQQAQALTEDLFQP
jgi:multiple sugar transport system substrate-binding protein